MQYAVHFQILVAESGWGDMALQVIFVKGLSSQMKDEVALRDGSPFLKHLINLAIELDSWMRERSSEQGLDQLQQVHGDNPLIPSNSRLPQHYAPKQLPGPHHSSGDGHADSGRATMAGFASRAGGQDIP